MTGVGDLRRPRGRAVLIALGLAFAVLSAAACGTPDTQTSVFLEIFDGTVVARATDVDLDLYAATGGGSKLGSLYRTAAAQTAAAAPLGSVVILAGADAGLAALHIQGQRSSGGALLSEGSVDVALVVNRQVSARLVLASRTAPSDAGAPEVGAGTDAAPASDGGGGSQGVDAGAAVDAGVDRGALLRNGDPCASAGVCGSGFCVDGVCCNNDCSVLCHGCNLTGARGTCQVFRAGSQCVAATCNASDQVVPSRTCDGNGNCRAAGAAQSCGTYRCQGAACLRSCINGNDCVSSARCNNNRCF